MKHRRAEDIVCYMYCMKNDGGPNSMSLYYLTLHILMPTISLIGQLS
jgi:hypothetical protein